MSEPKDIRPSPIAGSWYSNNADVLSRSIDQFINDAVIPDLAGKPYAVVAPHAGHVYSGAVAGYAYKSIQNLQPELIVVIAPMHQPYRQLFLTTTHDAYQTPLGVIPVARAELIQLSELLLTSTGHSIDAVSNDHEHSLEIELPFLQRIYKDIPPLLPVMVRAQSQGESRNLGNALFQILKEKKAAVIASTDLSHFYPLDQAKLFDNAMLHAIAKLDTAAMFRLEERGEGFACGLGAVAAVIEYAKLAGASRGVILKHATSAEVTGDPTSVVGYGSVALVK